LCTKTKDNNIYHGNKFESYLSIEVSMVILENIVININVPIQIV